jgi:hypothetical protein
MIIQFVLILGLAVVFIYALLERRTSRFVSLSISSVSVAGMYFVLFPESTNAVAKFVGVGRGADLVVYCWLVISLVVSVSLQFKLLKQHEAITVLARELALHTVVDPERVD